MQLVVASGKGGTGKTTLATSLALSLDPASTAFLDCDVEAPNAHLFLKPEFDRREEVGILLPQVDESKCTYCGRCAEVCQFHAIAVFGQKTLVFPELCHGCGSCTLVCPEGAISEELDVLGVLESGRTENGMFFARGLMDVGEPMAVPIICQLKKWDVVPRSSNPDHVLILDAPPGTSCPVVETVRGADFAILVTEPTPFGLHDLRLMVEVVRDLGIPSGVIINRDGVGTQDVAHYCEAQNLPVLMRIPLDREIGRAIAAGEALITARPAYAEKMRGLFSRIQSQILEAAR